MSPAASITILHISDMQFGKFHRFPKAKDGAFNTYNNLADRLIDDLNHLKHENQLVPDLIVCTGDLPEWGLPEAAIQKLQAEKEADEKEA